MSKRKILLLCGPSGAGKSYMENLLVQNKGTNEYIFKKLEQVTTRPRRDINDAYTFLSVDQYKEIEDTLIAKTAIETNDGVTNYYGTKPQFIEDDHVIHTVIVNRKGIDDICEYIADNPQLNIQFTIFMIDSKNPVGRANRDDEFVEAERKSLQGVSDKCYINDPDGKGYITLEDIYTGLKEVGLMEEIETKDIKCPWIRCKYNTGRITDTRGRCACPDGLSFVVTDEAKDDDGNLIEGLYCQNFIWDNDRYLR